MFRTLASPNISTAKPRVEIMKLIEQNIASELPICAGIFNHLNTTFDIPIKYPKLKTTTVSEYLKVGPIEQKGNKYTFSIPSYNNFWGDMCLYIKSDHEISGMRVVEKVEFQLNGDIFASYTYDTYNILSQDEQSNKHFKKLMNGKEIYHKIKFWFNDVEPLPSISFPFSQRFITVYIQDGTIVEDICMYMNAIFTQPEICDLFFKPNLSTNITKHLTFIEECKQSDIKLIACEMPKSRIYIAFRNKDNWSELLNLNYTIKLTNYGIDISSNFNNTYICNKLGLSNDNIWVNDFITPITGKSYIDYTILDSIDIKNIEMIVVVETVERYIYTDGKTELDKVSDDK